LELVVGSDVSSPTLSIKSRTVLQRNDQSAHGAAYCPFLGNAPLPLGYLGDGDLECAIERPCAASGGGPSRRQLVSDALWDGHNDTREGGDKSE
jgi:hypothetical protein